MLAEDLRPLQGQGNRHVTQKDKKQARVQGGSCGGGKVLCAGKSPHQQGDRPGRRGSVRASAQNTVWSVAVSTDRPAQTVGADCSRPESSAAPESRPGERTGCCVHTA